MFDNLRLKLNNSSVGKGVLGAFVLVAVAVAILSIRSNFGDAASPAASAAERVYICAETGRQFNHTITRGEEPPVMSPHSGKKTGWEAERCFWTADGKIKQEPSFVLLNRYRGIAGPTFCQDCGRLVVQLNPAVHAGSVPPPTKDEYAKGRGRKGKGADAALQEPKQDE